MVKRKVNVEHSAEIRALYKYGGVRGKELLKLFPQYSKSSIYAHVNRIVGSEGFLDKRKYNKGKKKLTVRQERNILRTVHTLRRTDGTFTSPRIQLQSGIGQSVSNRTVRRVLNKNGYNYRQTRRKGLLLQSDLKKRLQFCRKIKRLNLQSEFWQSGVAFYLDGTGFQYKSNPFDQARAPRAREWRLKGEGLSFGCTAKGKKEGATYANFMVAISYGKGAVIAKQYFGSITGQKFADIVSSEFPNAFSMSSNPRGKLFLMDGCPRQNSALAKVAIDNINSRIMKIPPRSPDLNPIENFFHLVGKELSRQALENQIKKETFKEFSDRCVAAIINYDACKIDAIIDSMNKRMDMVIKSKGQRIKY